MELIISHAKENLLWIFALAINLVCPCAQRNFYRFPSNPICSWQNEFFLGHEPNALDITFYNERSREVSFTSCNHRLLQKLMKCSLFTWILNKILVRPGKRSGRRNILVKFSPQSLSKYDAECFSATVAWNLTHVRHPLNIHVTWLPREEDREKKREEEYDYEPILSGLQW